MEKYYVIYESNGALQVDKISEWTDFQKAKNKYHAVCSTLGNEETVLKGIVKMLDEELNVVTGYTEVITHIPSQQS